MIAAIWTALSAAWAAVRATPGLMWAGIVAGAGIALKVYIAMRERRAASEARQEMETDALKDTNERLAKGREAVRDGRDVGSPADRLRRNEGRWD